MEIQIERVTSSHVWYKNEVGQQYEVIGIEYEETDGFFYIDKASFKLNNGKTINAADCSICSLENVFNSTFLESVCNFFNIQDGYQDNKIRIEFKKFMRLINNTSFEELLLAADWAITTPFFTDEDIRINFLYKLIKPVLSSFGKRIIWVNKNYAKNELFNFVERAARTIYSLITFDNLFSNNHTGSLWKNGLSTLELNLLRKVHPWFNVTLFNKYGKIQYTYLNSINSQNHTFTDDIARSLDNDLSMTVVFWKELVAEDINEVLQDEEHQSNALSHLAEKSIILVYNENKEISNKIFEAIFLLNWKENERYIKNNGLPSNCYWNLEALFEQRGAEYIEEEFDTEDYTDVIEYWDNH